MQTKTAINKLFAFLIVISSQALSSPQIRILPPAAPLNNPVYFSNTSQTIPLELTGVNECVNVMATLWQLTTRLGAELSQQSIIDCTNTKHDFTQASVTLDLQFTTPTVKHDSSFKFEFTSCNQQQSCKALGEFAFTVLPDDLLEPIRVWAKKHSLYVNDKSNRLLSFLDDNSIEYISSTTLVPKNEALISLIVITQQDAVIEKLLPTIASQSIILFRHYPGEFPLIIDKTNRDTPLLDVQIPLIEWLDKDAAAQKLFLKLFYMLPQTIVTKE